MQSSLRSQNNHAMTSHMFPHTPARCRSAGVAVSGVASKKYKTQLKLRRGTMQARLKAQQKAWLEAEQKAHAAPGAEYKPEVRLEAEFKAQPEAEYKDRSEQSGGCFCLHINPHGLLRSAAPLPSTHAAKRGERA